jgi:sulfur-oxidizing protein SoxZ
MADPMRIRAAVKDGKVDVRVLMSHEMETGQRKTASGVVPVWFIQNVTATHNGRTVLSAQWGPSISKNPYLNFRFSGGKPGDKVSVTWTDNKGDKRTDEAAITAG